MLYPEAREPTGHDLASWTPFPGSPDLTAARRDAVEQALRQPREQVADTVDVSAVGVACRLFRPVDPGPGTVLCVPGGGFVLHDLDAHDVFARRLTRLVRRQVLLVQPREAPEHPFPAALEDLDDVLRWLETDGAPHGLDVPVAVVGAGSGGSLAIGAALRNTGRLTAIALVCPMLEPTARFDSRHTERTGVDDAALTWAWAQYAGGRDDVLEHPELAPLHSDDLWTLPPTCIVTAEHDPCRGEGEHLARVAAERGAKVVASRFLGQVHDFARRPSLFSAAVPALGLAAAFVDDHLRTRQS